MRRNQSASPPLLVRACLCEQCEFIAPLKDFTIDAIGYVHSKAKPEPARGLRCPRCQSKLVSVGEMPAPDPDQLAIERLRTAIIALPDIPDELKHKALSAIDARDGWGLELIALTGLIKEL